MDLRPASRRACRVLPSLADAAWARVDEPKPKSAVRLAYESFLKTDHAAEAQATEAQGDGSAVEMAAADEAKSEETGEAAATPDEQMNPLR